MKKTMMLMLCMMVAGLVQAVDFETIRNNKESMTSIQFDQFKSQTIGQIVYWSGWVDEVQSASGGQCRVLIDMDAPDAVSVFDVTVYIPSAQAISLSKDQRISFQGRIKSIGTFLGMNISLTEASIR